MDELSKGIGPAAQIALKQAAAEDDADAASLWCARLARFGMVEAAEEHFHPDAEQWFQKAISVGNVNAMANLGRLKLEAGEPEAAESWFTAAAEKGHEGAMQQLVTLMTQTGRQQEADQGQTRLEGGAEAG